MFKISIEASPCGWSKGRPTSCHLFSAYHESLEASFTMVSNERLALGKEAKHSMWTWSAVCLCVLNLICRPTHVQPPAWHHAGVHRRHFELGGAGAVD
jgi:hypothetical protein